jgi:hypothetical protein
MVCRSRYFDDPTLSAAERDARRQVARLRGFYSHLMVFVLVNAGLLAINLIASPGRFWFFWPALGWGIWPGLACHRYLQPRPLAGRGMGRTQTRRVHGCQGREIIARCRARFPPCSPR